MTDQLSPAAQAVLDAAEPCVWPDECPGLEAAIAAALRAAADQVVPEEPLFGGDLRWMFERDARQDRRKKLLAIVTELKARP